MKNKNYDDLKAIRSMMEQSSRFISLSGWSGIMAGIYALIAAGIARYLLNDFIISSGIEVGDKLIIQLCVLAFVTLISAVGTGLFLSIRKSKNHNLKIWSKPAKNMLIHLSVPLIAGGLFCNCAVYQLFKYHSCCTRNTDFLRTRTGQCK